MRKQPFFRFWVAWSLLSGLKPDMSLYYNIETRDPTEDLSKRGKIDPMHCLPSFRLILSLNNARELAITL